MTVVLATAGYGQNFFSTKKVANPASPPEEKWATGTQMFLAM
jgi:hypothetical protein